MNDLVLYKIWPTYFGNQHIHVLALADRDAIACVKNRVVDCWNCDVEHANTQIVAEDVQIRKMRRLASVEVHVSSEVML